MSLNSHAEEYAAVMNAMIPNVDSSNDAPLLLYQKTSREQSLILLKRQYLSLHSPPTLFFLSFLCRRSIIR